MKRTLTLAAAVTAVVASLAAPLRADIFNAWGRHLGVGWSNGYHAVDGCCPGPIWALRPGCKLKKPHAAFCVPSPLLQPARAYAPPSYPPAYGPAPAAPWPYESLPYAAP